MIKPLAIIARDPSLRMIAVILFLYGTYFSAIGPYQALIAIQIFGLPDGIWSLVMFSASIVTVAASIIFGIISDQHDSRRSILLICAGLSGLGGLLVWVIPSPTTFLVVHMLLWPIAGSIFGQLFALARLAARRHGQMLNEQLMAAIRALFALAFVLALPFWSAAFAKGAPVTILYPVSALLALAILCIVLIFWKLETTHALKSDVSGLSFLASMREIATSFIAIRAGLLALISSANVIYMSTMGLLFANAPGRTFSDAAIFLTLVTGLEVPLMLAMGLLVAKIGRVPLIVAGGLLYGIFLIIFTLSLSFWWVWTLALPAALGAALVLSVPIPYLQELLSNRPGAGGSLLAVNQVLGFTIASILFAIGTAIGTYSTTAIIAAIICTSAACCLGVIEYRAGNWRQGRNSG